MSDVQRYTFGQFTLHEMERLKTSLESQGYTCSVEIGEVAHYPLCTLVAVSPKKEHPIQFTLSLRY